MAVWRAAANMLAWAEQVGQVRMAVELCDHASAATALPVSRTAALHTSQVEGAEFTRKSLAMYTSTWRG